MAKRFRRRTNKSRRRSTRRARRARPTRTLFGNKLVTKLKYQESFNLDPGALGVPAISVYSANGIYDPNISGVGHQPRGFDQIMTMFDHAVVIGAKITLHIGASTVSTHDQLCGIAVKDTLAPLSSVNDYLEGRNVRYAMLPAGTGANTRRIQLSVNPNKFLGRSHPLSDSELKNSAVANPLEQAFFHIFTGPIGAVDAAYTYCSIIIEYSVVFIEPKIPNQS